VARLDDHPTVVLHRQKETKSPPRVLESGWLRRLCLDAGADDVGFVAIERPELDDQRDEILTLYPWIKGLISIIVRMNQEPIRSPARSVANLEFHNTGDHLNEVAHAIVAALEARGIRALNPATGFPMEMERFGASKTWVVSHKPIAEAAGLGHMGIHRNVIHPKFGNFILAVKDEEELERLLLAYSPRLRAILDAARRQIEKGMGVSHEEFWRDLGPDGSGQSQRSRGKRS
jgi:hypothetical protein